MRKRHKTIWKNLDIYPNFTNTYVISEFGELRTRKNRQVINKNGVIRIFPSIVLPLKQTSVTPNLHYVAKKLLPTGIYIYKTLYVHRIVAILFLPIPSTVKHTVVVHIDENHFNNHYSNLKWITRSEMQSDFMKNNPKSRFKMRDALIKRGFYKNPISNRKLIICNRYFELKDNIIYNNYLNEIAVTTVPKLQKIFVNLGNKLISKDKFEFENLSENDIIFINENLPKNVINKNKL